MSLQATVWVLEHSESRLGDRLVLLSIANHADRQGDNSWASVATMAIEARMSERQVQRSLRRLEQLGELEIEPNAGPRGTNVYRLVGMSQPSLLPQRVTICHPDISGGGDKSGPEGVTNPTGGGDKSGSDSARFVTRTGLNGPRTGLEQSRGAQGAPGRAIRLPDNFKLTPQRRAVAEAEKVPAERTFAAFCDYWRGASGQKARKHDWDATWRNWCRREADRSRGASPLTRYERMFGRTS